MQGRAAAIGARRILNSDSTSGRGRTQGVLGARITGSLCRLIYPVYGWYPSRFGAKDAFRIGNYTLLANVGGNIGLEFIYSGPHSLLSRLHLNDTHGAPVDAHDAPIDKHAAPVNAPVAPLEGTKN
jgi:hypothetical protein